ncbi:cysteine--tRNA ligase [Buchnera aphidicola]|uniref:Cysteine--tRNA ligase n=1 Tax=Buchnera aphidicola subsp. Tuberolachnus salignus TaxID=98804 RepID=A0A170PC77_BUCTT|nr:cysteine--tRNA ligase [Buchnera aphidicola]CUR53289.1 Cysteine--tRNA ligase [Buchnera aphidicola (Tuberolachnus salignus)]
MLKIFNSLTKKKEIFHVKNTKKLNIYVCGVTIYDFCHIGHARTFIFFDIVIRYFKILGYSILYVRNITDIDDKIIQRALEINESVKHYTTRMIYEMKKDFYSLNLLVPQIEPCVTQYITEIIMMIKVLLHKKYAYISKNGDVVFKISKFKSYGIFSNQGLNLHFKKILNIDLDYVKNNKNDFVLWKLKKKKCLKTEIFWKSPWGLGRPGWHIECSTLNNKFFKNGADIHGGGIDLLFPHHENERAQNLSFQKNSCANFWMHVGMVIINQSKMSKSLKNIITIRNLICNYSADVIRYYLLSTYYRHPLNFSEIQILHTKKIISRMYSVLKLYDLSKIFFQIIYLEQKRFIKLFFSALEKDFNTPLACSILYDLSKYIKKLYGKNKDLEMKLIATLIYLGNILGIFLNVKEKNFFYHKSKSLHFSYFIKYLIQLRNLYRRKKQWDLADDIRIQLKNLNIFLEDSKENSKYFF